MAQANIDINLLFNEGKGLDNVITKLATIQKSTIDLSSAQKTSMDAMVASFKQMTAEVDTLSKSLKNTIKPSEINKIVAQLNKQATAIQSLENKATKFAAAQTKANTAVKKTVGILGNLKSTLKKLKIDREFAKDEAAVVSFNQRIQETEMSIRRMSNVGKKATNTFGNALTSFGFKFNLLANIASRVGSAITSGIISTFNGAIDTVVDFEQAQATLAAILQKTRSEIAGLTEDAKQYGATTFFTAVQVEKLQISMAKLGFTMEEIRGATSGVLSLAAAFKVDLEEAATVTASTLRGFNLEATESGRVADVIASAFANSALDLEKFKVAISKVAPIASSLNVSLEATTAALGTLTNKGFDASTAGTQLRNIFLKFADVNSDLTKRIGFTVRSSEDFIQAFKVLNSQGLEVEDTMQLVDKRSVALLQALTDAAGATGELNAEFIKAQGTADEMAEEQLKTLSGSVLLLKSAWDGFILSLEDGTGTLSDTIKLIIAVTAEAFNLASGMGKAEDRLSSAQLEIRATAQTLIKFGKALGAIVVGFISATIGIKLFNAALVLGRTIALAARAGYLLLSAATGLFSLNIGKAVGQLKLMRIALATNPIGVATLVITAAVAAFIAFSDTVKVVTNRLEELRKKEQGEVKSMNLLFNTLKQTNISMKERKDTIFELNRLHGQYVTSLIDEKSTLEDINRAQKEANRLMLQNIEIKIRRIRIQELLAENLEKEDNLIKGIIKAETTLGRESKINVDAIIRNRKESLNILAENILIQREEKEIAQATAEAINNGHLETLHIRLRLAKERRQAAIDRAGFDKSEIATLERLQGLRENGAQGSIFIREGNELQGTEPNLIALLQNLRDETKSTDDEISRLLDVINKMPDALIDPEDPAKILTGRLNDISEIVKNLRDNLKGLSAKDIDAGLGDDILKQIEALQLEAKLIKSLGDEKRNQARIDKLDFSNKIRQRRLNIKGLEDEEKLVELKTNKELAGITSKLLKLEDEARANRVILSLTDKASSKLGVSAKKDARARLDNIEILRTMLLEVQRLTKAEADQAIAKLRFDALQSSNSDTLRDSELEGIETIADKFFSSKVAESELHKQILNERSDQIKQEQQLLDEQLNKKIIGEAEYRLKINDLEREAIEVRISLAEMEQQRREAIFNRGVAATKSSIDAVGNFQEAAANKATEEVRQTRSTQLRIIQQHLDQGVISEQEYQLRKTFFEEEAAKKISKIKQDLARKDKQIAIIQAIIDGALAVQKIAGQTGIYAPPFIAASILATASQVALIESQPIPQFEDGGKVDPGKLYGPRHKKGGITVEAEGGEFFNDRKSTNAYLPYLEAANEMRLPEFIMANDVQPMLELQMAGVNKGLAESMANSMGFYDGNIVRAMQKDRALQKEQVELLGKLATNQHRNARA